MGRSEQAILADRLRKAAQPVMDDARARSARWSRRVPLSVRLQGGSSRVTIAAGGKAAPQAYTMEGRADGAPVPHPVFAHGPRVRGPVVDVDGHRRHVPPGWHWVNQTPRPFLREAIDAQADEMARIFSGIVDDWARDLGYRL